MNHDNKILNATLARELHGIRDMLESVLRAKGTEKDIARITKELDRVEAVFSGFKGDKGDALTWEMLTPEQKAELKGKDGEKPVKGKDYFTKKEIKEFIDGIRSAIKIPVKGKDYYSDEDRASMIADLEKIFGKKGYADKSQFKKLMDSVKEIARKGSLTQIRTIIKDSADTLLANPARIARALEKLVGKQRLDAKAIKNLPSYGGGTIINPVYQKFIAFSLESPTSSEVFPICKVPYGMTVTNIAAAVYGGTSLTFNIEERAAATLNSSGTDIMTSDIVATQAGAVSTTFSNAGIDAGNHLVLVASAMSGTVGKVEVRIDFSPS